MPRTAHDESRAPQPSATSAALRHAGSGPSTAREAAANAARSAAPYARCRAARTPPAAMNATPITQINPMSASTQSVPDPRSPITRRA
ncbi:hypothetical protein HNR21_000767 [Actinomadura cellulosilytica]|uniref:Uncharacterized protein n=1 Tax=Thermomonospora cellulosilytica TaxID=1411118 RepID=A0A7W3MU21_9ACTN|nr:hypothetical protein [Thermomonospora cellulosilytica]